MSRPAVSLNALRAFEASARHLSFTRAADELCVTQAAVSHLVKGLEDRLGAKLFRRSPRGLVLTDEGLALVPALAESFERIDRVLERFEGGRLREVLTLGVVGAFAVGWLLPRLPAFRAACPFVDLRLLTNNNKVDLAGEGLDCAIRFGDGAWHGAEAEKLFDAPLTPLCAPEIAVRLSEPRDLEGHVLLRSYRPQDWPAWFIAAGIEDLPLRGPLFDNSWIMAEAAIQAEGVALAPALLFERQLTDGRLVRPFRTEVVTGAYWLTRLTWKPMSPALRAFRDWLTSQAPRGGSGR